MNYCSTNLCKNSFTNRVVAIWNQLPNNIVATKTINSFKKLLDEFLIDIQEDFD